MNSLNIALRFLKYKLFAGHKLGFGIHSPFAYNFVREVMNRNAVNEKFEQIEELRKNLLKDKRKVSIQDYGAGSKKSAKQVRSISELVKNTSVNKKFGELLCRTIDFIKPEIVLELGTSLGISTLYLAAGNHQQEVITIEGCPEISEIARENFSKFDFGKITQVNNTFENALPTITRKLDKDFVAYIDGNHTKEATLYYFNLLVTKIKPGSVIIIDDINWSDEMRLAWNMIKDHHKVKVTIDLFYLGILIFKDELQKQDYTIRY